MQATQEEVAKLQTVWAGFSAPIIASAFVASSDRNALIAAIICGVVADFGALSIFDAKADVAVSTYYMTDRTHIKNAAYDFAAPTLATVIDTLLLSI